MRSLSDSDPKKFIADFFECFTDDLLNSEDDPEMIIDRYHTPDIVQVADGHMMDRAKLVAHTRPVRKNRPESRVEVHEALAHGDRIAARYTLYVQNRGKPLVIDVHFFGRFAADGRMREAHMLTRSVPISEGGRKRAAAGTSA